MNDIEFVNMTKENVGTIHPTYGGTLMDLMKLSENTDFFVTNGNWYGSILTNKKGEKCIGVWETGAMIPITDNNRYSLWLNKIDSNNDGKSDYE